MNAYQLWARTRQHLRESGRPDDPQRQLNDVLAEITIAEDDVIATVGGPILCSYLPVGTSSTIELRPGQETYPASTSDTRVVADGVIYNTLQPWTWWTAGSPIADGQILEVEFRRTSSLDYVALEETSVEALRREDGADFESTSHGTVPTKWYTRQLHDQAGSGYHTTVLGLYPPWTPSAADARGIRIFYIPRAMPYPVVYGTGITSTGSVAVSTYVNCSSGSATVYFKGAHTTGTVEAAADIITDIDAATLSLPSGGLTAGMELGLVSRLGGLPRAWYVIRSVITVADLDDYDAGTQSAYAAYIVGFTVQPAIQEIAAGAWAVDHRFVVSSPSLFGRSYGNRAQVVALLAASRLAGMDHDHTLREELDKQYHVEILRACTGIYRRTNHAADF